MEGLQRLRPESITQQECEGSGTTSLDPEVWGHLPFECLCCILERVPADSLIRWRRVSKTWVQSFLDIVMQGRSTRMPRVGETVPLYHAQLGSLRTSPPTDTPHRIAFTVNTFNRSRNTWEPLPLNLDEAHSKVSICSSSHLLTCGGIILLDLWFRNLENQMETSMTVFNPTTAQRRQLPPSPDAHARPIGILSSSHGRSYAVVATKWVSERIGSRLFVYKSDSGSWHDYGASPRGIQPKLFDSAASVGNVLYFIVHKRLSIRQKLHLCAFDLTSGTCQELGKLPKHYGSGRPNLLVIGGDLLFVATTNVTWYTLRGLHRSWRIYKFDAQSRKWNGGTTMPARIFEQLFASIEDKSLNVSGAGNYIYFYGAPAYTFGGPHLVLAHNRSDDTWEWLPDLATPLGDIPVFEGEPNIFTVEPSLMPV